MMRVNGLSVTLVRHPLTSLFIDYAVLISPLSPSLFNTSPYSMGMLVLSTTQVKYIVPFQKGSQIRIPRNKSAVPDATPTPRLRADAS